MFNFKGKRNPNYKDGRTLKKHHCENCGTSIFWATAVYRSHLCNSCALKKIMKGKKPPPNCTTKGLTWAKHICYCCIDCGNRITYNSALYGNGRCRPCSNKLRNFVGENNPHWKKSLTNKERTKRRNLISNEVWIKAVLVRDNYTCQNCNQYGGRLVAHHINGYHWCKELRFEVYNGITFCQDCHNKFHKKYGFKWINSNQLVEFFYE